MFSVLVKLWFSFGCLFLPRAEPFHYLKLMLVGFQNKGKTTVLGTLCRQSTSQAAEAQLSCYNAWEPGMTIKSNKKVHLDMSTVSVAVGDWSYAPRKLLSRSKLPVISFMTWDFGGQVLEDVSYFCVSFQIKLVFVGVH